MLSWASGLGVAGLFVASPLFISAAIMNLRLIRENRKLTLKDLGGGFKSKYYWKSVVVYLLTYIFTYLWTLLFIIPGIIKGLSYSLAPYVLADNPELSAREAIDLSMKMMNGHKGQLFGMMVGMVALVMLSIFLLYIPLIWLVPFYQVTMAKFYEEVKAEYNATNC
jgi:uncharacterized membrane protein